MFKEKIKEVRVINGQIKRSFLRIKIIPLLQGWVTRKFKDPKHLELHSHNFKLMMQHWKRFFFYKQNLTKMVCRLAIPANIKTKATLTRSSYWLWRQFLCLNYPFRIRQENFIYTYGETFNLSMNVFLELILLISKRGFTSHFIELLCFCLISIPSQMVHEKKLRLKDNQWSSTLDDKRSINSHEAKW